MQLKESKGTWDCTEEDFVYFHTNYTDKSSFLVVECVLVRDIAGLKTYTSSGYGLCDIFLFKGTESVDLTRGTPRSIGILGLDAVSKNQRSGGRLEYEIRDFPSYDKLKQLLP